MKTRPVFMTVSGLAKARADLVRKRHELSEIGRERDVAFALSGDGWHDNPHFNRLQQLEAEKTNDIAQLQDVIDNARVVAIDLVNRPVRRVAIGSIIRLRLWWHHDNDEEAIWEIAGWNETDLDKRKLAYNTPLAAPLMGAAAGDAIEVTLPKGKTEVEVVDLLPGWPPNESAAASE
jgi:transcription elongation factor GreA